MNNETFGLKAGSESNDLYWKQFLSGASNITLTIELPQPAEQAVRARERAQPGRARPVSPARPTIGADDITLSATVGDVDNAEGDDSLPPRSRSRATAPATPSTPSASELRQRGRRADRQPGDDPAATVEGWRLNGSTTEYSYDWYAITKDAAARS